MAKSKSCLGYGLLLLAALLACAGRGQCPATIPPQQQTPWPTAGVYSGYALTNPRMSEFRPAGTAERWWLRGDFHGLPEGIPTYIAVRGSLDNASPDEIASGYQRRLVVDEIIEPVSAQTAPWPSAGVFAGSYVAGFEVSDFVPAGTTERPPSWSRAATRIAP
jgi:hypothetical protein